MLAFLPLCNASSASIRQALKEQLEEVSELSGGVYVGRTADFSGFPCARFYLEAVQEQKEDMDTANIRAKKERTLIPLTLPRSSPPPHQNDSCHCARPPLHRRLVMLAKKPPVSRRPLPLPRTRARP